MNTNCQKKCETKFEFKPEGSVLAVQMSPLPPNFEIYTSNVSAITMIKIKYLQFSFNCYLPINPMLIIAFNSIITQNTL